MAIYLDVNLISPTVNPQVFDVAVIYQSIYQIISVRPGEGFFDKIEDGLDLEFFLFEDINDATALSIYRAVTEAVTASESRITLDMGKTTVISDYDNNSYDIKIYFKLNNTNDTIYLFDATLRN